MFIDIKTKADIFTIKKGCFISKLPRETLGCLVIISNKITSVFLSTTMESVKSGGLNVRQNLPFLLCFHW